MKKVEKLMLVFFLILLISGEGSGFTGFLVLLAFGALFILN